MYLANILGLEMLTEPLLTQLGTILIGLRGGYESGQKYGPVEL